MLRQFLLRSLMFMIALTAIAAAQGTYTQIDVPGSIDTACLGVNQAGDIVGFYQDLHGAYHGFVLSGGSFTTLDYPGASASGANGINDKGWVVGTDDYAGFLYSTKTGEFRDVIYPGGQDTVPIAINNAGWIVGYVEFQSKPSRAFGLVGSNFYLAGELAANEYAEGVTGAGEVVGYAQLHDVLNFSYYKGIYQTITILGVQTPVVRGTNNRGDILIGDGFVYQNGVAQLLVFDGRGILPRGVNDSGEVVGLFLDTEQHQHGFIWIPDTAK